MPSTGANFAIGVGCIACLVAVILSAYVVRETNELKTWPLYKNCTVTHTRVIRHSAALMDSCEARGVIERCNGTVFAGANVTAHFPPRPEQISSASCSDARDWLVSIASNGTDFWIDKDAGVGYSQTVALGWWYTVMGVSFAVLCLLALFAGDVTFQKLQAFLCRTRLYQRVETLP